MIVSAKTMPAPLPTEPCWLLERHHRFMDQALIRHFCAQEGRVYVALENIPLATIDALWGTGHTHFSQKYSHELLNTKSRCPGIPLSFYGRLQSRKIATIAASSSQIESVARLKEAEILCQLGYQGALFIQVNISAEVQKNGVPLAQAATQIDAFLKLPLQWVGLMAIPAITTPPAPAFKKLRALADQCGLPRCMMGMSADYEVAIEEGATDIRIRRLLLGPLT